jgi:N-acetylmuramoyl-L-alanine amidase
MTMATEGLPLRVGADGAAVRDLQRRLVAAGFEVTDDGGRYAPATEAAVRRFQQARGLTADGICGRDTWTALVEAGYHLGDRLLYLRSPMLRGDDVGELQRKLGALGFDSGRVDAILGPTTERALKDFQRNAGLTTDGVCGPDVLAALGRLGGMTAGPVQVAGIREREHLERIPRRLADRRIVIGDLGGLSVPALRLARVLREGGAVTMVADHPDRSAQATQANEFDAELYIGLCISSDDAARTAYYATVGFESIGGRQLAELVAGQIEHSFPDDLMSVCGMRLPVLRETRMPAVVCHLRRVEQAVERTPLLASALSRAIGRWVAQPVGT